MEHLKAFLISRLLIVVAAVVAVETVMLFFVQQVILPVAAGVLRMTAKTGGLKPVDLLFLLGMALFGIGQKAAVGVFAKSLGLLLLLFALFLLIVPITAGILTYAGMVTKKVDSLVKIRDAEREEQEKQRSLMLSDFAHDLRTPIMTISGYAQAMADGVVKEENRQEYLEAIRTKSGRMSELINLLFDYVRLGSAGYQLNKEPIDVNALLLEIAASAYTDAEEAGMTLEADIPEEPFMILADKTQLSRVIQNLITNAIRHNEPGTEIAVLVRRMAAAEVVAVADTGTVIEKSPEELFEPFVKGDSSRSGDKGSGLGLSIAKKITDMHGFDLTLSQPYESYAKAFLIKTTQL